MNSTDNFLKSFLRSIIAILPPYPIFALKVTDISQKNFITRQQHNDDLFILDVRTREEFIKGHIKGAINISLAEISTRLNDIPKDKDLIIYCRSGRRAKTAAKQLSRKEYTRLFHLDGDMLLWEANHQPIVVGQ